MDRYDDWKNTLSTLGSVRDKSVGLTFARRRRLDRHVLEAMYEQSPLVARIVDRIVDDSLREGWRLVNVDGEVPDDLESRLDDLGLPETLARGLKWARLYGGALLTLPVLDGLEPEAPLDLGRIQRFYRPSVVPAYDARPLETDVGFNSPTYGRVLRYEVVGLASQSTIVHHSRVVPIEPVKLPLETLINSGQDWGPSVIERVFDDLGRRGASRNHAVSMMYIASILYLKLAGFREAHTTKGGREKIREMLADVKSSLDSFGLLGLDAQDDIGSISLSVNGAYELIDRMDAGLAAAAEMPKEILYNESPAGLNAGELSGPQKIWYARCRAFQREEIRPILDRALAVAFAAWGVKARAWEIEFNDLHVPTPDDRAAAAKGDAETDKIQWEIGALTAEEIREHRLVRGVRGPLQLDEDAGPPPLGAPSPEDIAAYESATAPPEPVDPAEARDVTAATTIVEKVASGSIPRDAGAALLAAAGFAPSLLGSAGVEATAAAPEVGPSTDEAPDDLLSPQDAAARYQVPTLTITRLIRSGDLPYWGLGRHQRVSAAAVAALARSHETPPAPA